MMQPRRAAISGWGRYPVIEADLYRVERMRELPELLQRGPVLARGLGRSYGDAALASGAVLLMERLDRFLSFDAASGILRCESGASLAAILEFCIPRGFFLPVVPGTRHVTVGGAIACDIHGKNHHRSGAFSTCVIAFDLLTAAGAVQTCSRTSAPELFHATIGGIGLTGIMTDVTLQLARVPSPHVTVRYDVCGDLDEAFERFSADDDDFEYSVAWIDALARGRRLGRSVLMRANHSQIADRSHEASGRFRAPRWSPPHLFNQYTVGAFNALYFAVHRNQVEERDYESYFFQLDRVQDWNRLYGKAGFTQYQFVVPTEGARAAVGRALAMISAGGVAATLGVLKRMGTADAAAMLSFPIAGYTLAVDLPMRDQRVLTLMNELDAVVTDHGGRIYLAKDARAAAPTIARMYGSGLSRWREVKARVDPDNRFTSLLAERLELAP